MFYKLDYYLNTINNIVINIQEQQKSLKIL